jgi:protein-tyrosine phosphatase
MIDLHTHILPGADDGARDIEESIAMCAIMAREGTTAAVASPHDLNGTYENRPEQIRESVASLNSTLQERGIGLSVIAGADVCLDPRLVSLVADGRIMTLNDAGKYILLELPHYFHPDILKRTIFELGLRRITAIITHPERNEYLMAKPGILISALEAGALSQVTAASITGLFGGRIQKHAHELLRRSMAHIIASDCHNITSRSPGLLDAVEAVSRITGPEAAMRMVKDIPEAIVRGDDITPPAPIEEKLGPLRAFIERFLG